MKKRRIVSLLLALLLFVLSSGIVSAAGSAKEVDVMFLHDTHSHLNSFATVEDGKSQILGGFVKIKTLINQQKNKNPDTLLLDAGDFSMGTLIQVLYEEEASEIRMLGELGMDVTTFGNHEFDYKASGLANMLNNAVTSGDNIPPIVVCNIDWASMQKKGLTEDQKLLKTAFENYGVKDYIVVEKNGVKIAITGVFGKDSLDCVPNCPIEFKDPVKATKETVKKIKAKEDPDMIVCVSHSGTWDDPKNPKMRFLQKAFRSLTLLSVDTLIPN